MIKHQGGCHCGKVRFQAEADPWMVFNVIACAAEDSLEQWLFS